MPARITMIAKIADSLFARVEDHLNFFRAAVAVLAVVVIGISSARMIQHPFAHGDFGVYLHAARLMASGVNIYATPSHPVENGGLFYIYPPLLAFLFIPLTHIPENLTIVLWTVLNVVLLAWMVPATCELFSGACFSMLPAKTRWAIGFFSIVLTGRFIQQHLDRGQTNILALALVVLGIGLIKRASWRPVLGGALIGISIALKVLPAPFVIWLVLQKQIKALTGVGIGLALGLVSPALLLGWKSNASLLSLWFNDYVLNSASRESKLGLGFSYSIRGVLFRFFTPATAFEHAGRSYSLTIAHPPLSWIIAADWIIRFAILALVIFYWFRFRNSSDLVLNGGGSSVVFAAIPLLFPTTQQNYFVFLLPAVIYAMYLLFALNRQDPSFEAWIAAFFVLGTLTVQGICGKFLSDVFMATGCVIVGALCLIAAVFRAAQLDSADRPGDIRPEHA
jgi:hypothetical protein